DRAIDDAMKQAWMAQADTAVRVGLVDAAVDLPNLSAHLESGYSAGGLDWVNIEPDEGSGLSVDRGSPMMLIAQLFAEPDIEPVRETIAVLHIDGPIIDGESTEGGFFGEPGVGSITIRRILEDFE